MMVLGWLLWGCGPIIIEVGEGHEDCTSTVAWDATCVDRPDLCDLEVHSLMEMEDLDQAVDIVFVGDGFTRGQRRDFELKVDSLWSGMLADPQSIVGREPTVFNRHRVALVSSSWDVGDDDVEDTPLGGCLSAGEGGPFLTSAGGAVRLAGNNAPDADVVVVILNTLWGRANASLSFGFEGETGQVNLHRGDSWKVLDHELGHALVGLQDEYSEGLGTMPAVPLPQWSSEPYDDLWPVPNLTRDPTGARWAHHEPEMHEGGARYDSGVYHAFASCRMLASGSENYCPVCDEAVEAFIGDLLGRDDGPPRCVLTADETNDAALDVRLEGVDYNRGLDLSLQAGGQLAQWSQGARYDRVDLATDGGPVDVRGTCRDRFGSEAIVSMSWDPDGGFAEVAE